MEKSSSRLEIFRVALKLGLTSFGGPVAHLGYFHEEYAVVGLLLTALYNPVWARAVHTSGDLALALVAFGLLAFWKLLPWMVVGLAAVGGELFLRG